MIIYIILILYAFFRSWTKYVLRYALGDLCPSVDDCIKACSELVVNFKRCELNSLLSTSLKQKCDTRWNTAYEMLNSIKENFDKIEDILMSGKEYAVCMDALDERLLKDLTTLLSYFKEASEQLSADEEPTLHLVL